MSSAVVLVAVATALSLLQPALAGRTVNAVAEGTSVTGPATALVLALLGHMLFDTVGRYRLERIGEGIVLHARVAYARHVLRLPVADLDTLRTGDLLARASTDTTALREIPRSLSDLIFGAVTAVVAVVFMFTIDPLLVGLVLGIVAVAFVGANLVLSRIQRVAILRQEAVGDFTAGLERSLGAIRTVKLFGAQERDSQVIAASAERAYTQGKKAAFLTALGTPVVQLALTGSFLAILVVGGGRVANGNLQVGQLVTLFMYAMYAIIPLSNVLGGLVGIRTALASKARLVETLTQPTESASEPLTPTPAPAESSHSALARLENLSFDYGKNPVLTDVSFDIGRNEVTALVGPSGAGKSTILALLCKFYTPTEGVLRWNGNDYASLPAERLRENLALVEQDAPVLFGTIRDNLTISKPEATDDELWQALRQANLDNEINAMPEGLDSAVLDRGKSLSGGQRQRLSIARALLSPASLILMDEPTAHLDRVNEYELMENLLENRGTRSLFVIAHRLSTVTRADRIVVLDGGTVVTTGTHEHLLDTSPIYQRLIENELHDDITSTNLDDTALGRENATSENEPEYLLNHR
ncbi:ABC transporter ATP-binding protein [Rhodococcus qingshengii]|uniref:ABC transporter ATP-binding protein n=1 Tax=Rhodococcus qingshengii TaxID=334542 RepID=UPI001BEC72D2|nr:ABC transporter ATP-binding protein [Rhodococcus qingshengii]MBT2276201.1 ABC transporter ATP-binding protein [Rhodococcus qingshengii]